jgi:hypothetical protein
MLPEEVELFFFLKGGRSPTLYIKAMLSTKICQRHTSQNPKPPLNTYKPNNALIPKKEKTETNRYWGHL